MTLWTVLNEGLLTSELLWQRGILATPECPVCRSRTQSSLHVLRDFPAAEKVWRVLLSDVEWAAFRRPTNVSLNCCEFV